MLQNRVDPEGNIISTSARGAWMGNRGQLHDDSKRILRPFKLKAWLICQLKFKGRKRPVMAPNLYTELFFLDEATALAAGHRPCCECRRQDYDRFKLCWLKGNPAFAFNEKTAISEIDQMLHLERINQHKSKVTFKAYCKDLPEGTFILIEETPWLVANQLLYRWTAFGYDKIIQLPSPLKVTVLTPKSTVNAFREGYVPQMSILKIIFNNS